MLFYTSDGMGLIGSLTRMTVTRYIKIVVDGYVECLSFHTH